MDCGVHQRVVMTKQPWILIVDDDAELLEGLADVVTHQGYQVQVAANGAEAINRLDGSDRPCAIVLDLLMPGLVGQELIEYLGSEPRLQSIPLAIVSGSPQLAPPGHKVFTKPVDVPALLEFIGHRC